MTNLPEARLAREAEICYATLAMVTDYDCWHPEHGDIDIRKIRAVMQANSEKARHSVRNVRRADSPASGPFARMAATAPWNTRS